MGRRSKPGSGAEVAADVAAVGVGELDVEDDEGGRGEEGEAFGGGGGFEGGVAGGAEARRVA